MSLFQHFFKGLSLFFSKDLDRYPDLNQGENSDPHPDLYLIKNQNPDPHQGDKSNPDPRQRDSDPQHCIEESRCGYGT